MSEPMGEARLAEIEARAKARPLTLARHTRELVAEVRRLRAEREAIIAAVGGLVRPEESLSGLMDYYRRGYFEVGEECQRLREECDQLVQQLADLRAIRATQQQACERDSDGVE
jgi:uncharacterized coiled-coil DUF342 family protein